MTAIPRHRGQLGHIICQPVHALIWAETPWWETGRGYWRIVLILVLVVLVAHGYPLPSA